MNTVIRKGRIVDPANKRDEIADLFIVDGRIADQSAIRNPKSEIEEIDASNLIAVVRRIDDPAISNHRVHGVAIPPQR